MPRWIFLEEDLPNERGELRQKNADWFKDAG